MLEAYVVGVDDVKSGTVVGAAVVARSGHSLDGDTLRANLRNDLSAYQVPKYVWVADKQELPFTDTGKLREAALAAELKRRYAQHEEVDDGQIDAV